ncbi:MAG: hypothetical protein HY721_23645, partial [Planctomycetes bacterium]|nr:hypothetical protein [Planctomycetota bacterium]
MSDLGFNDTVLVVNKRVLRNLAISLDLAFEPSITWNVGLLDIAVDFVPQLETWLNRGLEHPVEYEANAILPVPRLLYATTNPAFSPSLGSDDLVSLRNHVREIDDVAPGPTSTLSGEIAGVEVPCPLTFRRDDGRRWTFLREAFFDKESPDFIEVKGTGLLITIEGKAYRGGYLSRNLAQKQPTHQFVMKLSYEVDFLNDTDTAFGRLPFVMVEDPPPPAVPGGPSLPPKDSFVFAKRVSELGGYFLPSAAAAAGEECPGADVPEPPDLKGDLYKGTAGDLLFDEPDTLLPPPRFRVEPRSSDEPERLVLREIGDPSGTILAEAQGGRLFLKFVKVESLELTPLDGEAGVSSAERDRIGKSLTKIHPAVLQGAECALDQAIQEGDEDAKEEVLTALSKLKLLGPRGLHIPLMPQSVAVPVAARVVGPADEEALNAGFPLGSVKSDVTLCKLTQAKLFPSADPARQAFAVSGKIGGTGDADFGDFTAGADLGIGISQLFMSPMLQKLADEAVSAVKCEDLPGLDKSSVQASFRIAAGSIDVVVTGQGEIETPFFLPNFPYEFEVCLHQRLRTQRAVMVKKRKGASRPVDRFGCEVPEEALEKLGLSIAADKLDLAEAATNPLCFLAYHDPEDGVACFLPQLGGDLAAPP